MKKNQQGSAGILFLIVVALIIGIGAYYLYSKDKNKEDPAVMVGAYYKSYLDKLNGATNVDVSSDTNFVTEKLISDLEKFRKDNPDSDFDPVICALDFPKDSYQPLAETAENDGSTAIVAVKVIAPGIIVHLVNKEGWRIDKIECSRARI